jgi:hypothetical protein
MIKFLLPLAVAITAFSASAALGAPADFDPGFGQSGRLALDSELVRALTLQPDGKIVVAAEAPTTTPGSSAGAV